MKIYTYSGCSTCKKATKWLREHDVAFDERPIRDTPPSKAELKAMLKVLGDRKKLFNVSGQDYRALNMKDRLPNMSDAEVIDLLADNGNLIKRPFVIGEGVGLVGFNEALWASTF